MTNNFMVDQSEYKDMTICDCGGKFKAIAYCPNYSKECDGSCGKLDDDMADCKQAEERFKCKDCGSIYEAA